jgi:sugar phosphate permease
MMAGLPGIVNLQNKAYFYVTFAFIGACNSLITPTFIAIMGRWFPRKNRGALVGIWSTCNNVGHIIGIQFAAGLMRAFGTNWGYMMETMAGILCFVALVIWIFLVSDPKYLGITIQELTGKEIKLHKLENQR